MLVTSGTRYVAWMYRRYVSEKVGRETVAELLGVVARLHPEPVGVQVTATRAFLFVLVDLVATACGVRPLAASGGAVALVGAPAEGLPALLAATDGERCDLCGELLER